MWLLTVAWYLISFHFILELLDILYLLWLLPRASCLLPVACWLLHWFYLMSNFYLILNTQIKTLNALCCLLNVACCLMLMLILFLRLRILKTFCIFELEIIKNLVMIASWLLPLDYWRLSYVCSLVPVDCYLYTIELDELDELEIKSCLLTF